MLDTLITSKTRIKLLLKFFLNSNTVSYLRKLENEFNESSNAIRLELNRFEKAGLLISYTKGNKKYYKVNTRHPLYNEINKLIIKYTGIDQILENVIKKLGGIKEVYLTGSFCQGIDSNTIEIIIIANNLNIAYLEILIKKAEKIIKRNIKYFVYNTIEIYKTINKEHYNILLLWAAEK